MMRKISDVNELRQIQMELLSHLLQFCNDNKLNCWPCAGTMLGAVRHKGYIPWDDDIDVMMPRNDFEKLVYLYPKHDNSHYKLFYLGLQDRYTLPFSKLGDDRTIAIESTIHPNNTGVSIDIFPIDKMPNSRGEQEKLFKKLNILKSILALRESQIKSIHGLGAKIVACFLHFFFAPIHPSTIARRIVKETRQFEDLSDSKFSAAAVWGRIYGIKEVMPNEVYNGHVELDFEKMKLPSFKDYNTYLTNLFGDYMTPPPIEKQNSTHVFEAYWKD